MICWAESTPRPGTSVIPAPVRLDLTDGDHGPVPDAAVKLLETEVEISRTQIHGPISAVGESPHGAQHAMVLLAELVGRGMHLGRIALRKQEQLDPQAVDAADQHLHA